MMFMIKCNLTFSTCYANFIAVSGHARHVNPVVGALNNAGSVIVIVNSAFC